MVKVYNSLYHFLFATLIILFDLFFDNYQHENYDHMGKVINLVDDFKVEKVISNCGEFNDLKSELINNEINTKVKCYSINKSDLNTYY